eukprot:g52074.t1
MRGKLNGKKKKGDSVESKRRVQRLNARTNASNSPVHTVKPSKSNTSLEAKNEALIVAAYCTMWHRDPPTSENPLIFAQAEKSVRNNAKGCSLEEGWWHW